MEYTTSVDKTRETRTFFSFFFLFSLFLGGGVVMNTIWELGNENEFLIPTPKNFVGIC